MNFSATLLLRKLGKKIKNVPVCCQCKIFLKNFQVNIDWTHRCVEPRQCDGSRTLKLASPDHTLHMARCVLHRNSYEANSAKWKAMTLIRGHPSLFWFLGWQKNGDAYLSCKIIVRDKSREVLGTCASDFFCLLGWSLALGGGSGRINGFLI